MDKVVLGYDFSKSLHGKDDYEGICYFVNSTAMDQSFSKSNYWKSKKHAWSYGRFEIEAGVYITISFGYTPTGHRARFQFNGNQLTQKAVCSMEAIMMCCLFSGWHGFLKNTHVTYVEFAYDVVGANFSDFVFLDSRARTSNNNFEGQGSAYRGSRSSGRHLLAYDKANQLKETKGINLDHPLLRIEARLQPKNRYTLSELPDLPNPFAPTTIVDRQALMSAALSGPAFIFRSHLSKGIDVQAAYQMATLGGASAKKEFANGIQQAVPAWWEPAEIWKTVPTTLAWTSY